jgi:hypothetical protein
MELLQIDSFLYIERGFYQGKHLGFFQKKRKNEGKRLKNGNIVVTGCDRSQEGNSRVGY